MAAEVLKGDTKVRRRIPDGNPVTGYDVQRRISEIFLKRYVDAMEKLLSIVLAVPVASAWQRVARRHGGSARELASHGPGSGLVA